VNGKKRNPKLGPETIFENINITRKVGQIKDTVE
jgi:hypothetical protein